MSQQPLSTAPLEKATADLVSSVALPADQGGLALLCVCITAELA